jgi:hypothetical protein
MNTYWSYEERDGGLYMQIESVTLTRSIPNGLAWIVRPFVESIPRESLEFTLSATRNALLARSSGLASCLQSSFNERCHPDPPKEAVILSPHKRRSS